MEYYESKQHKTLCRGNRVFTPEDRERQVWWDLLHPTDFSKVPDDGTFKGKLAKAVSNPTTR